MPQGAQPAGEPPVRLARDRGAADLDQWITELPWNTQTEDNMDLRNAMEILEEDHYGLEKVKARGRGSGGARFDQYDERSILCFVGPPGVARRRSRARLRGLWDANSCACRWAASATRPNTGAPAHHIGAIPGRIMSNIRLAKTNNPVFLFDEVDKIGHDFREIRLPRCWRCWIRAEFLFP